MTRKQRQLTIEQLERTSKNLASIGETVDYTEFAIEALEQEPCGDAISRADAKKYLSAPNANGYRVIYESDLVFLPPVQPESKTGHWIEPKPGVYRCSSCGRFAFEWGGQLKMSRYCPNCGCRMESEVEENG